MLRFSKWLNRAIVSVKSIGRLTLKLISKSPKSPFSENASNRAEKAKKWLKIAPILVAPLLICISLVPSYAHAGIFSWLSNPTSQADAQTTTQDSDSNAGVIRAPGNPNQASVVVADNIVDDGALLSSAGVNGTVADIENAPTTTEISLYVVRPGDSLSQIAKMFGVSVNTIIWANDITGPINPGDKLVILPISGVEYTIKKGDTVESIAKKLGGDAGDIAAFNGVADSTLVVGSSIIIPDGELSSTAPIVLRQGKITNANLPPEPAHNTNGPSYPGYYALPLASACVSQGLHGYNAVDLATPKYTPIYAVAAGTVIVSRDNGGWNGGYGNYVVISHSNDTQTLYAHMTTKTVLVSQGETVSQGEEIGEVGMTGEATGPHLHIEVRGAQNPFLNEYPSCY